MKKVKRLFATLLALCFVCALFVGCGSDSAEHFLGSWSGYKISATSGGKTEDLVFADYASIAKIELITKFTDDGKYELHYYVAGKEGTQYPKFGTYEMDGDRIILLDDDGYGEIVDGELILYFDNGDVAQYFRKNS